MHFEVVQGDLELTSHAGLVLGEAALSHTRLRERVNKVNLRPTARGPRSQTAT